MSEPRRVLVAMSGGVDSSVAAALLSERGHDLVGVTLHLWDAGGEDKVGRCCAPEDREDARRTCDHLGIPHYVFDERAAFREHVVDPFMDAYLSGTTPSPCVHCNQQVKLGRLLEIAHELGATHVATGHYARVEQARSAEQPGITGDASNGIRLLRGRDSHKDQSYFLYGVPRPVLAKMIFPLGDLEKDQTRREGRRLGVPNWDKGDSQELCFVPDGDVGGFLERQGRGVEGGDVVDAGGRVLGRHAGHTRFTVGQRRGLGLGGGTAPRYVLRVLPESREVVVGDEADLYGRRARATRVVWTGPTPADPFEAEVQIRYRHAAAPARVHPTPEGFEVEFTRPQRAIAPGQAAVVYRGEQVVGGGVLAA